MSKDSYKTLKAFWYQVLKDAGFVDLETPRGNQRPAVDLRTLNRALKDQEAREGYFEQAAHYLPVIAIEGSRDWHIWRLHCDGLTVRAISKTINVHHATVQFRIKKMRRKANLG